MSLWIVALRQPLEGSSFAPSADPSFPSVLADPGKPANSREEGTFWKNKYNELARQVQFMQNELQVKQSEIEALRRRLDDAAQDINYLLDADKEGW